MATKPTTYIGEDVSYCEVKRLSVELGTAAGVYTAAFKIPADSILLDVGTECVTVWNAGTSSLMDVGDAADPNGHFAAINMAATDLTAGQSINFAATGGKQGAYFAGTTLINSHWLSRYSASDRTISFVLTTVGTAATTGDTLCWVKWGRRPEGSINREYGTYAAS